MIVSVMNPPYQITPAILNLVAAIAEKIGRINAKYLDKPSPQLRKENRIKTIHSSLSIEGNTLTIEQITSLLDNKRIIGPKKDVNEVLNAIKLYDQLQDFDPVAPTSFLLAHQILMKGLVSDNGKYRKSDVGIMAGDRMAHLAPPADQVPYLMNDLFAYLKKSHESSLIKSCVFHYEMEFIHPFVDGNGRMGRFWQTLILMKEFPIFEFLPFENLIHQTQEAYYLALASSDQIGASTPFIAYMLGVINDTLSDLLNYKSKVQSTEDRLAYFSEVGFTSFNRKDYMSVFQEISSATASRDLKKGVEMGLFTKQGDKIKSVYEIISKIN